MNDRTFCSRCGDEILDHHTVMMDREGRYFHYGCRHAPRVELHEVYGGTIHYCITPRRFILDIPVEALANLTPDAHTRILAMLNAWITEHKPKVKP